MKKLSEYLTENVPDVSLEDAKKSIIAYRDYMCSIRGTYCDICYKPITFLQAKEIQSWHFHYCCDEHLPYADQFNTDAIRRQLGIDIDEMPIFDIL